MCSRLVSTTVRSPPCPCCGWFADHREGVVADLAVGHQVIGTDQIAGYDVGLGNKSSISMVRVDSKRDLVQLVLGDFDVGVGIDLCSPS